MVSKKQALALGVLALASFAVLKNGVSSASAVRAVLSPPDVRAQNTELRRQAFNTRISEQISLISAEIGKAQSFIESGRNTITLDRRTADFIFGLRGVQSPTPKVFEAFQRVQAKIQANVIASDFITQQQQQISLLESSKL